MKHLIVVSVDAMVFEDLELARTLPAFSKILDGASLIERVRTIYPSVTHPVHATLITGAPAGDTGIVNNFHFYRDTPEKSGVWFNELSDIKCDTLLHAAKRSGLTTATCTWPLTTKASGLIDYLVPGMMNDYFLGYEENPIDAFKLYGASECLIDIIEEGIKRHGYLDVHPSVDDFQFYCAGEILKRYKPNLMLIHPGFVDNRRHLSGVFSRSVDEAITSTDKWLGILLDAIKEAGIENDTGICVLSDHGQINITRSLSPNVYFYDEGLIKTDEDGRITDWLAYSASAGASAQVYLKDKSDKALYDKVYALLTDMKNEGIYGIGEVLTASEAEERYSLYGDFSFVIDTDGYTSFGEWLSRPSVRGYDFTDYRYGRGTHGQLPHIGPQPIFIVNGPAFKSGVIIENGDILNHAPTLVSALGISLKDAKGKPIYELLNNC